MQLYQFVIIAHEVDDKNKRTGSIKILKDVTTVVASDTANVLLQAAVFIPAEYQNKLELVEVVHRPF
jgi:hypothetical protein